VRPSIRTSSLLEYWPLKPRALMAHLPAVDLRHVESRNHAQQIGDIECARVTNILPGDDEDSRRGLGGLLLLFDTEVTSIFIRSSRLFSVRSKVCAEHVGSPGRASRPIIANATNRREIWVNNAAKERSFDFCDKLQNIGLNCME
jgi:hypothetical protein